MISHDTSRTSVDLILTFLALDHHVPVRLRNAINISFVGQHTKLVISLTGLTHRSQSHKVS